MDNNKNNFISLFSGCGGLDLGFIENGFRCKAAFDNDPLAVENYRKNIGDHVLLHDLGESDPVVKVAGRVDIVLAGPPCQGFSTAGKRDFYDPRNSLLLRAGQISIKLKPKVIIIENVPGVISGKHKRYWDGLVSLLKISGYDTKSILVRVNDYGVAQIRKRVILIATKGTNSFEMNLRHSENTLVLGDVIRSINGVPNHNPQLLDPVSLGGKIAKRIQRGHKLCNVRGGKRAIPTWQLPEVFGVCSDREIEILLTLRDLRRKIRTRNTGDADPISQQDLENHLKRSLTPSLRSLINKGYIRQKGERYDLTHTFNGLYRRLSENEPSLTVDTRFGSPRYFLHPHEDRGFTIREAARIQGFPDCYEFFGSEKDQYRMIGNAVPPPLAEHIGRFVKNNILN